MSDQSLRGDEEGIREVVTHGRLYLRHRDHYPGDDDEDEYFICCDRCDRDPVRGPVYGYGEYDLCLPCYRSERLKMGIGTETEFERRVRQIVVLQ